MRKVNIWKDCMKDDLRFQFTAAERLHVYLLQSLFTRVWAECTGTSSIWGSPHFRRWQHLVAVCNIWYVPQETRDATALRGGVWASAQAKHLPCHPAVVASVQPCRFVIHECGRAAVSVSQAEWPCLPPSKVMLQLCGRCCQFAAVLNR